MIISTSAMKSLGGHYFESITSQAEGGWLPILELLLVLVLLVDMAVMYSKLSS
jgi:hypothetical protein